MDSLQKNIKTFGLSIFIFESFRATPDSARNRQNWAKMANSYRMVPGKEGRGNRRRGEGENRHCEVLNRWNFDLCVFVEDFLSIRVGMHRHARSHLGDHLGCAIGPEDGRIFQIMALNDSMQGSGGK